MKKILLIDNDPVILKLVRQIFETEDYKLVTTEGGLEALEKLEKEKPDLVIVDLVMSNLSGKTICEVIRNKKEFAHLPIVILSAVLAEESSWDLIGADAFVAKGPYKELKANLLKVVKELLSEDHRRNNSCASQRVLGVDQQHPRQVVKELLEANERLLKVISHISEGLIETDSNFRIINLNYTSADILGKDRLSLLGENLLALLDIESDRQVRESIKNLKKKNNSFVEFQKTQPTGRIINVIINPVFNHNGPSSYIALLKDITDKRRLYQEHLERARLTVMFEMAGTITHEFRQPLTVIQGLAELAERKLGFLEGSVNINSVTRYLEKIKEECNRLNQLTIRVANITQYRTRDINKGRIVQLPTVEMQN